MGKRERRQNEREVLEMDVEMREEEPHQDVSSAPITSREEFWG